MLRAISALVLAVSSCLAQGGAQPPRRVEGPGITVYYRAGHEDAAIFCANQFVEVRQRGEVLVGGTLKGPIRLELLDSAASAVARSRELGYDSAPEWAGGLALPAARTALIVVPSSRNYRWSLYPTLAHEVAHLLVADRLGEHSAPHWLNEGVAQIAEGSGPPNLWLALPVRAHFGWLRPIAELDGEFLGGYHTAPALAYAQAHSFTRFLEAATLDGRLALLFDRLARGESIRAAVQLSTLYRLEDLEGLWHADLKRDRSWMPWLFSQVGFGVLVLIMLIVVRPRIRRRRAEAEARLLADEAEASDELDPPSELPPSSMRRLPGVELRRLEEGEDEPRV